MRIDVIFSVDWEGTTLLRENLEGMRELGLKYPMIPRVQFLNPTYYYHFAEKHSAEEITRLIRSSLMEHDEIGHHVHAWEALVNGSGVEYRNAPAFFHQEGSRPWLDFYGGDVPITTYTREEFSRILSHSVSLLKQQEFPDPVSFRGGGWCSGEHIQAALLEKGFKIDSSPVDSKIIGNRYPGSELEKIINNYWSHINEFSAPEEKIVSGKSLKLAPNNVGLCDYINFNRAQEIFEGSIEKARKENASSCYFHYGWHQETLVQKHYALEDGSFIQDASGFYDELDKTMSYILMRSENSDIEVNFTTLKALLLK